jgi:hypothetical protein
MEQEQTTQGQTEQQAQVADDGGKVREHPAFKGVLNQLAEERKRLAEYEQRIAAIDAEKKAEVERKAIEAGEYKSILAEREAEIATLKKETQRKDLTNLLIMNGAIDDTVQDGLITRYEREQPADAAAWIATQKTAKPHLFSAAPIPMSSGPAGNVASGKGKDTLEARLTHPDPKVRKEAAIEIAKQRLS